MVKWFEINLGWFFVNDHYPDPSITIRKQEQWNKYLKEKYESK
jgi:hypothetical protein